MNVLEVDGVSGLPGDVEARFAMVVASSSGCQRRFPAACFLAFFLHSKVGMEKNTSAHTGKESIARRSERLVDACTKLLHAMRTGDWHAG